MWVGGQRYATGKDTRFPLYRRLGGPQGWSEGVRNISLQLGFDSRTFQSVASRYTDHAIRHTVSRYTDHAIPIHTPIYEGVSKIFRTGAIYTAVVVARSTGGW
jgi:hypothetical protein